MQQKAMMQSSVPSARCFSVETPPAVPAFTSPGAAPSAEEGALSGSSPPGKRPPSRRLEDIGEQLTEEVTKGQNVLKLNPLARDYASLKPRYGRSAGHLWGKTLLRIWTTLAILAAQPTTLVDLAEQIGCPLDSARKYVTILRRCGWPVRLVRGSYGACWYTCDLRLSQVSPEGDDSECLF